MEVGDGPHQGAGMNVELNTKVGELMSRGLNVVGKSNKQYNKDVSGLRKRYGE